MRLKTKNSLLFILLAYSYFMIGGCQLFLGPYSFTSWESLKNREEKINFSVNKINAIVLWKHRIESIRWNSSEHSFLFGRDFIVINDNIIARNKGLVYYIHKYSGEIIAEYPIVNVKNVVDNIIPIGNKVIIRKLNKFLFEPSEYLVYDRDSKETQNIKANFLKMPYLVQTIFGETNSPYEFEISEIAVKDFNLDRTYFRDILPLNAYLISAILLDDRLIYFYKIIDEKSNIISVFPLIAQKQRKTYFKVFNFTNNKIEFESAVGPVELFKIPYGSKSLIPRAANIDGVKNLYVGFLYDNFLIINRLLLFENYTELEENVEYQIYSLKSLQGEIYVFDLTQGKLLWNSQGITLEINNECPVYNGAIWIINKESGEVEEMDLKSGSKKQAYMIPDLNYTKSIFIREGKLVYASFDKCKNAVPQNSKDNISNYVDFTYTIKFFNKIYGTRDFSNSICFEKLKWLDVKTGEIVNEYETENNYSSPLLFNNILIVGSPESSSTARFYYRDISDLKSLFNSKLQLINFQTGEVLLEILLENQNQPSFIIESVIDKNILFLRTFDGWLYAIGFDMPTYLN